MSNVAWITWINVVKARCCIVQNVLCYAVYDNSGISHTPLKYKHCNVVAHLLDSKNSNCKKGKGYCLSSNFHEFNGLYTFTPR